MRKALFLAVFVALMACGAAIAADKIGTFGAPNASGTYPMEVTDARAITVASDATLTVAGTTSTAALTATSVTVDGSIYTGTVEIDGAIYLGTAAVDPCATLGTNAWAFFNPAGALCICKAGVAENTIDGTTNCY